MQQRLLLTRRLRTFAAYNMPLPYLHAYVRHGSSSTRKGLVSALQPATAMDDCCPVWFYQHPSYGYTWQEFPGTLLHEVEMAYQDYTKNAGAPWLQIYIGKGVHHTTATIDFNSMHQISSGNIRRKIWRLLQPVVMEECRPVWFYQHPSSGCTWQEFPPKILHGVEMA